MKGLSVASIPFALVSQASFQLAWGYSFDQNPQKDHGSNGAVACESAICSRAGTAMLEQGGNAADAMVASVLCVGVVGMYNSGIAGGGFALIRLPNNSYEVVDFRETAPAASSQDMFKDNKNASESGGLASAVPGEIRGLEYILNTYGHLNWSQAIQPAIEVARDGFVVGEDLTRAMNATINYYGRNPFLDDPAWKPDFAPKGKLIKEGDIMTRKRYAATLQRMAHEGPGSFYSGHIAQTMIRALAARNGTMTLRDLANYTITFRDPVKVPYRDYTLTSTGAPSSGTILLTILGVLNQYKDFFNTPSTVNISTHRMVEAMKFGYGYRGYFGDPTFVSEPSLEHLQTQMLQEANLRRIARNISDVTTQDVRAYDPNGTWTPESHGTSHIVTADKSGLAVSLTTTVNLVFGNLIMVPETGIIMNNEMDDFSIPNTTNAFGYPASPKNFIAPGKRPLSSISPVIVTRPDGSIEFISGAAGGSRIPTATLQTLIHALDEGLPPHVALALPRLHHQLFPNTLYAAWDYDNSTLDFLRSRQHVVQEWDPHGSNAQAILQSEDGIFVAASEPLQVQSGGYAV